MKNSTTIARWSARLEAHLSTHAFTHLFIAFYAAATFLMFVWGAVGEYKFQQEEGRETLFRWLITIARGAGYSLNLNCAFVILLAARLFFTWLRDTPLNLILPLDKAFPLIHIIVGYTIAVSVVIHAVFHLGWIIKFDEWDSGLWSFTMSAATGFFLLATFALMIVFSLPSVRKKHFTWFYRVHIVGAVLFFLLLIFHGMFRQRPETYKYITPPLIIYLLDRVIRKFKRSEATLELNAENSAFKDDKVLELRVPKPFNYKSGQYAEIKVPSLNREWHPFTIASAAHEDTMVFYIKNLGDWTSKLHDAFQQRMDGAVSQPLIVQVRGPFGAPAQHVNGYERVILIAGGIGGTPFSAICKELHHLNKAREDNSMVFLKDNLSEAEARVQESLAQLYDADISNKGPSNEETQQRNIYVSDMLRITANNSQLRNLTSPNASFAAPTQGNTDPEFDAVMIEDDTSVVSAESHSTGMSFLTAEDGSSAVVRIKHGQESSKKPATYDTPPRQEFDGHRQSAQGRFDRRARLLAFLHTSRVYFALLISLVIRIVILCFGSILKSPFMTLAAEEGEFDIIWSVIADTAVSFIFVIVLPLTVALEVSFMGHKYFHSSRRILDFITFFPLTIIYTAVSLRTSITGEPENTLVLVLHYVMYIPLVFLLLAARLYRSIGSRDILADECTCHHEDLVPEVDFVWTSPDDGSDEWLRRELEPLSGGTDFRLHRYITRANKDDLEYGEDYISTQTGRPKWEQVFSEVARTTHSGASVGVFFCGPHPMGKAARAAMRRVEITSNLRGAFLNGTSDAVLEEDLGVSREELHRLRQKGCAVRFVFREENFG